MSYSIELQDPVTREVLEIDTPHFIQGGTYCIGGTTELELNITYNYGRFYKEVYENGIREIYNKTGAESIPMLKEMIAKISEKFGTETDNDYWKPVPGNAIRPLYQLISFAQMRPDGVWDGD